MDFTGYTHESAGTGALNTKLARDVEATQQREPEVLAQLKRLEQALTMQDQAIERIAHRLEFVTSPRSQIAKEETMSRPPVAPLACRLAEMGNVIMRDAARINDLTDSLEI